MTFYYWPDCPIPGCPHKICLSLDSDKCYPHTLEAHCKSIVKSIYLPVKLREMEEVSLAD